MKLKIVLLSSLFALGITACSTPLEKLVYRIDVPQGNYIDAALVQKLQKGMTEEQVQYLLGTPLLVDPFNNASWVYVQRIQKGYETPIEKKLIVHFNPQRTVESFNYSPDLPPVDVEKIEVEQPQTEAETSEKSWWQFWK
ncbi:outer membrane protein assembly factor BamE [Gallibacterium anatis]|uniref:Outer membrane protein assembly factor BamE n=1 Tax=Gallibacterium anatis 4895 TaxID=1396510 RepID=A0A0A3A360_9PAST|nr:outer membrane protein assembly factor BamE [Gallibacterium anatis]KGQ63691.1 membrane protein SmpA [Gallibacterium anatis 4895]